MADGGQTTGMLAAMVPLLGTAIGFLVTWQRERDKTRKAKIAEIYTNLIKVMAESASMRAWRVNYTPATQQLSAEDIKWRDTLSATTVRANAEVVLYGSPAMVTALSAYWDSTVLPPMDPQTIPRQSQAFVNLYQAMRRDVVAQEYPEFGRHVDNILGTGNNRRAWANQQNWAAWQQSQAAQQHGAAAYAGATSAPDATFSSTGQYPAAQHPAAAPGASTGLTHGKPQ